MPETADVMVISPHADDAEGGCGGTVAKWIKEGKSVVYVLCTNGDKGTSDPAIKPEQLAVTREKEQLAAADVLGVREVIFLRHPDQGLEETPEFRKELVHLIRMYRPDTVITVDPYRKYIWHRDHRITGQVVLDAIFPYARDLYAYPDLIREGLEPFKVKEILLWASEEPNYNVDITDVFDMKVKALRCHESQVGAAPLVEMEERIKERSRMYAEGEDYELAESFHRVELFR
ncbi:MAG: PIG-L family deacetylase [Dehalococcoidales bacterium]|nr:PIG-L family deacetylase [Dehalococcoidales bacterium]